MEPHFQTYYSNRTETLYSQLKEGLFATTTPLSRRIVIVPSPAMKSWLTLQLAKDPDIGIAAGIEVGLVEPSMRKIVQAVALKNEVTQNYEPTEMELSLGLEMAIHEIGKNQTKVPTLVNYLGPDFLKAKITSKKTIRRISSLAAALAQQFIAYGIYGQNVIRTWEDKDTEEWQHLLWQKMESLFARWNYPARKLNNLTLKEDLAPEKLQIQLFGLSYFPPLYLRFLQRVAGKVPVSIYLLSPCQKFWGDILTPREGMHLKNFWKGKLATASSQEALDALIKDNNPLLAKLGKVGREMANRLEEFHVETLEHYSLPESTQNYHQYTELATDDLSFEASNHPLTLLEAIQADMVLMRNPESEEKISFRIYDSSIQVHAAPKKCREVQAVYDILIGIVDEHAKNGDPITPGDILVMAPNISAYLPFIRSIFGGQSTLEIQLMEPQAPTDYEVVRGFVHLLALAKGRWEASAFVELLEFPSFRRKLNLDLEDVNTVQKWIKEAKIFWGADDHHRNEIMQKDYSADEISESQGGTWEHGLGKMLEGLVFKSENSLGGIDFSKSDLLGTILQAIRSLREDFKPLTNGKLSLQDWAAYLTCLLEAYFSPYSEDGANEGYSILLDHIKAFENVSPKLKEALFTFDSVGRHLVRNLQKESTPHKESKLDAVKFSSLLPMRTVPAKVIVLMGMGDGEFPRIGQSKSMNLLNNNPAADYYPEDVDFDRYLFLEAILAARNYLVFSYVSQEPGNTKEIGPSLLVKEVLNYLDSAFTITGISPSTLCCFKHPLDAFDAIYFTQDSRLKSYFLSNYKAALAYYHPHKTSPHSFIQSFDPLPTSIVDTPNGLTIELKELTDLAKNPYKVFLNSQGIYLDRAEDRQINDEGDIFLSSLNEWIVRRDALKGSLEKVLIKAESSGLLPQGSFNTVARNELQSEIAAIHDNLRDIANGEDVDIFSITFNERQGSPSRKEKEWLLPPLVLNSPLAGTIKIVGKIDLATPQGMLLTERSGFEKIVKHWPSILAYLCLIQQHRLPCSPQILIAKDDKCIKKKIDLNNPEEVLTRFVDYYLKSKERPSPLTPDQIRPILANKMHEKQGTDENDSWNILDPYEQWINRNSPLADIHEDWQSQAKDLFAMISSKKGTSGGNHEDV